MNGMYRDQWCILIHKLTKTMNFFCIKIIKLMILINVVMQS